MKIIISSLTIFVVLLQLSLIAHQVYAGCGFLRWYWREKHQQVHCNGHGGLQTAICSSRSGGGSGSCYDEGCWSARDTYICRCDEDTRYSGEFCEKRLCSADSTTSTSTSTSAVPPTTSAPCQGPCFLTTEPGPNGEKRLMCRDADRTPNCIVSNGAGCLPCPLESCQLLVDGKRYYIANDQTCNTAFPETTLHSCLPCDTASSTSTSTPPPTTSTAAASAITCSNHLCFKVDQPRPNEPEVRCSDANLVPSCSKFDGTGCLVCSPENCVLSGDGTKMIWRTDDHICNTVSGAGCVPCDSSALTTEAPSTTTTSTTAAPSTTTTSTTAAPSTTTASTTAAPSTTLTQTTAAPPTPAPSTCNTACNTACSTNCNSTTCTMCNTTCSIMCSGGADNCATSTITLEEQPAPIVLTAAPPLQQPTPLPPINVTGASSSAASVTHYALSFYLIVIAVIALLGT